MPNNEFVWNDELVKDFICDIFEKEKKKITSLDEGIAFFKKSKQPILDYEIQCLVKDGKNYWVQTNKLYKSDLYGTHLRYQWFLANGAKIHSVKRLK